MRRSFTIDRALTDRRLLGAALGKDIGSWSAWIATLRAAHGLPLDDQQQQIFASVAGGRGPPTRRVRELWCVVGRRGGKSRMAAALAIYNAIFVPHRLAAGERGMVLVLAASTSQARAVFGYCLGFLQSSPALAREMADATRNEIRLKNGVTIAIHANSFRTVRGSTLLACILDEVAFWRDESSATPDVEVYRAILPALATTNGMMIGISTPYRKLGLLHQKHRQHYGQEGDDVLVVAGGTKQFNSTISDAVIDAAVIDDPASAASEWDAQFRNDLSAFLDDALIDAAVEHGRPLELPPALGGYHYYKAFVDASGGTGHDSYTIAIGHKAGDLFVIDAVRGTTGGHRFDPQEVTKQFAALCKEYGVSTVTGDNYASEWVAGAWRNTGIAYVRSDTVKSQLYLAVVPLFTRGLVRLPDHAKLLRELRLLERQTHRGGKESVDHPRGGHDDFANSVCGTLHGLSLRHGYDQSYRAFLPDGYDAQASSANQRLRAFYQSINNSLRWGA